MKMHDVKASAKALAKQVLEVVWQNAGFPVDPVTISRKMGIEVIETNLPDNVSGALLKKEGRDPTIVIHGNDSKQRKRFSCAHELGHYFMRLASGTTGGAYEYVDFRGQASSLGTDPDEVFANEFAANLLMPEVEAKRLAKEKKSIVFALVYFGVSESAFTFRLKNLGITAKSLAFHAAHDQEI